jgi:hypothetical protein
MTGSRIILQVVLPLLLVAAVVGALLFRPAARVPSNGAPPPETPPRGGFRIETETGGNRVLLEAEAADRIEPPFALAPAGGPVPEGASGGISVYLGPEKVNETADNAQYEKGHPAADHPGFLAWRVRVPATDEYALWVRAFWVDDCGDSVGVSIDGSPPRPLGGSTHGRWTWNLLRTGEGAARVRLEADPETPHEIRLLNREDDLYIDQVLLLGTDRAWPEPTGAARP